MWYFYKLHNFYFVDRNVDWKRGNYYGRFCISKVMLKTLKPIRNRFIRNLFRVSFAGTFSPEILNRYFDSSKSLKRFTRLISWLNWSNLTAILEINSASACQDLLIILLFLLLINLLLLFPFAFGMLKFFDKKKCKEFPLMAEFIICSSQKLMVSSFCWNNSAQKCRNIL